jgi:hypothetical protein
MSFLLAKDTCAAHLRQSRRLVGRLTQHQGLLHVSAITVIELELWLLQYRTPSTYLQSYSTFMQGSRNQY